MARRPRSHRDDDSARSDALREGDADDAPDGPGRPEDADGTQREPRRSGEHDEPGPARRHPTWKRPLR